MAQAPLAEPPLRGVPLSHLLSNAGAPLRTRADTLPLEEQAKLYDASQPCAAIDFFISHSWHANGFHKYLSLRRHLMHGLVLSSGIISALLIAVVRVTYPVRLPGSREVVMPGASAPSTLGVSEFIMFCLLTWTIRATAHRWWRSSSLVFLDCCCIPQTDAEQKRQGILRLDEFLERSRQFLILWDDTYFDRLWCVYELAVFVHHHPSADVVVLPSRLAAFAWQTEVAITPFILGFIFMYPRESTLLGMTRFVAFNSWTAQLIMAWVADRYLGARLSLMERLSSFDTRNAGCSVDEDRRTLYHAIESMYPEGGIDEFNTVVRTVIKAKTLASLSGQHALIPYEQLITASPPWFGCSATLVAFSASRWEAGVGSGVCTLTVTMCMWVNILIIHPLALAVTVQLLQSRRFRAIGGRLGAACVGASVMFTGVIICAMVPITIANGGFRRLFGPLFPAVAASEIVLRLPPWTAPLVALLAALPLALLCARFYFPSFKRRLPLPSYHKRCG